MAEIRVSLGIHGRDIRCAVMRHDAVDAMDGRREMMGGS